MKSTLLITLFLVVACVNAALLKEDQLLNPYLTNSSATSFPVNGRTCNPQPFLVFARNLVFSDFNLTENKRKSWNLLTLDEKKTFLTALVNASNNPLFISAICFHASDSVWRDIHRGLRNGVPLSAQLRFLPWHTAYLTAVEKIIGVPLPFWNVTEVASDFFYTSVMSPNAFGINSVTNPGCVDFSQSALSAYNTSTPFYDKGCLPSRGLNRRSMPDTVNEQTALSKTNIYDLTLYVEGSIHATIHNTIGGNAGPLWSPSEPLFWLFHGYIDALFLKWVQNNPDFYQQQYKIDITGSVSGGNSLPGFNVNISQLFPGGNGNIIDPYNHISGLYKPQTDQVVGIFSDMFSKMPPQYFAQALDQKNFNFNTTKITSVQDCLAFFSEILSAGTVNGQKPDATFFLNNFINNTDVTKVNSRIVTLLQSLTGTTLTGPSLVNAAVPILQTRIPDLNSYVLFTAAYEQLETCFTVRQAVQVPLFKTLGAVDYIIGDLLYNVLYKAIVDGPDSPVFSNIKSAISVFKTINSGQLVPPANQGLLRSTGQALNQQMLQIIGAHGIESVPTPTTVVSNITGWTCNSDYYNAMDGCDCGCGIQDPDCNNTTPVNGFAMVTPPITGCKLNGGPSCVAGSCVYSGVPQGWTCNPNRYNATDGCDCGCGIHDPDCDLSYPEQYNKDFPELFIIHGCVSGARPTCPEATCVYPGQAPSGWTCPSSYYGSQDGCDCQCGAFDPDCNLPDQDVLNCPCPTMTCNNTAGICTGVCGAFTIALATTVSSPTTAPPTTTVAPTTTTVAPTTSAPTTTKAPTTSAPTTTTGAPTTSAPSTTRAPTTAVPSTSAPTPAPTCPSCPSCPTQAPTTCPSCPSCPIPTPAPSQSRIEKSKTVINVNFAHILRSQKSQIQ